MVLAIVMILPTTIFAADYTILVGEKVRISTETQRATNPKWSSSDTSVASISGASSSSSSTKSTLKADVKGEAPGTATITVTYTVSGVSESQSFTVEVKGVAGETPDSGNTDSGNTGSGNTDSSNTGSGNTDSGSSGSGNTDSGNTGSGNSGNNNSGSSTEPKTITIVADGNTDLYDRGDKTTLQLKIKEGLDVSWEVISGKNVVSVSSSGLVTAKSAGNATIRAYYNTKDDVLHDDYDVTVLERGVVDFKVEENTKISRYYYLGESFDTNGIDVYVKYNDSNQWIETNDYTVTPSGAFTSTGMVTVKIGHPETSLTHEIEVEVADVKVESVTITSPTDGYEVEKNGKVTKIVADVTYNNGKTESLTTSSSSPNSKVTVNNYKLGDALTKDTAITVTVGGVTSNPVLVTVKEDTSKSITGISVKTMPTKTSYNVNDTLSLTGLELNIHYANGTKTTKTYTTSSKITADVTKLTKEGEQTVTLTYTDSQYGDFTTTFKVTVGALVKVYGINQSTSGSYKYTLDSDAKLNIGDELDWEDFFDSIYITYYKNSTTSTKSYKKITDNDDLEDFLGTDAKLHLVVADKKDDADVVEEDDVDDDEVELELYLEYAGEEYNASKEVITFTMKISDIGCTVKIMKSASSSTVYETQVFDNLKEALEALEDYEDEFEEDLKSSYVISLKLGENQNLSTFKFAPEFENDMILDLNGYELKLRSEWIDYDDCDDLTVIVTNTNEDKYGTLVYTDKSSLTLVVAEDSELEFSEGEIPMESDAACMVTIMRSSTSTTVIATKIYDDLREALEAMEAEDDFEDEFGEELASTNVIKIQLGEDQSLSTYKFAPDYNNAITIDLNGYELKLRSEWIDYDDCATLKVSVTNTNADEAGELTYTDLSKTIEQKKGDAVLKFEKGKIPGIYNVTIADVTNGTVKADKSSVTHGGTVTFTITPAKDYEISTVKVGTKTISKTTAGYSVSNTGVGTYKMEGVTNDVTMTVTFKKTETKPESSADNWDNPFTDISSRDQYYESVAYVVQRGLFNGMSATKFEPKGTTTRAQYVTVLGRLAGVDVSKYNSSSYTDVSTSDASIAYAVPYIEWATEVGIINGYGNGKFGPKDNITHQQMYLMMYRYALYVENMNVSLTGVSLSAIRDSADIATWAEDGVKFASRYGILITSNSKLTPADNALRCELAMLLHGFCTKVIGE